MIDYSGGAWTLGTYIFWPVFVIGLVFLVAAVVGGLSTHDTGAVSAAFLGLCIAVVSVVIYWPPLDGAYHHWYPVSGVVAQAPASRLITDGGKSVNQRFVLRFAGSGTLFGCDDTRCATLKVGDTVKLQCKRKWQFRGTPGWVCNYDQSS
jgi:hypothetical protein